MKKLFLASVFCLASITATAQPASIPGIPGTVGRTVVTEQIPYALAPQRFFGNSVSVQIPSTFVAADQNFIAEKYPDPANYPKYVFTDNTKRPMLALNLTSNVGDRESIIHFFRDMKNDLMKAYPTARFIRSDVIRNRTLAVIEVILPNKNGDNLYNMMAFRYVGNNFFFLNFTCPQADLGIWQDTARNIAENVKVERTN